MAKKIMNAKHLADLQKSMQKSSNSVIYAPLSKSVCAAMLAGAMVLGGGYSFLLLCLRMLTVM